MRRSQPPGSLVYLVFPAAVALMIAGLTIAYPQYQIGMTLFAIGIGLLVFLGTWYLVAKFQQLRAARPGPVATGTDAGVAEASGKAHPPTVGLTGDLLTQITRASSNPGSNEVNWTTEGKRERHIPLNFKPRTLRFFSPLDVTVESVPHTIQIGSGQIIVTRFFDAGFMVDEIGTTGDVIRAEPYRE